MDICVFCSLEMNGGSLAPTTTHLKQQNINMACACCLDSEIRWTCGCGASWCGYDHGCDKCINVSSKTRRWLKLRQKMQLRQPNETKALNLAKSHRRMANRRAAQRAFEMTKAEFLMKVMMPRDFVLPPPGQPTPKSPDDVLFELMGTTTDHASRCFSTIARRNPF